MLFSLALLLMKATASQPQIQVGLPEHPQGSQADLPEVLI